MPNTSRQRRAAFAELDRRDDGGRPRMFRGMSDSELGTYAHSKGEAGMKSRKKGKGKGKGARNGPPSAADQAEALRAGGYGKEK